jgi:PhnB protein
MTTPSPSRPAVVPPGYTTVTPWMITPDTARLLDFVHRAFDAEELARIPGPDGRIGHAEFRIGDSIVMAFDARPHWPPTPAFLRLYVADGDAVWQRAVDAGAEPLTRMVTHFWGDRGGRVRDQSAGQRVLDPDTPRGTHARRDPASRAITRVSASHGLRAEHRPTRATAPPTAMNPPASAPTKPPPRLPANRK